MFQIPSKLFDLLFYAGIAAIVYFVLPELTKFIESVSTLDASLVQAIKDAFIVWSAVWLSGKHNGNHNHNNK